VAFLLPLRMAEFMQINTSAGVPSLLNIKDAKSVLATTSTVVFYYGGTNTATVTFSVTDSSYNLQRWFLGQVTLASQSDVSYYVLGPLPKVPNNDAVTISSVGFV
jgi:hypothetical protein